MGPSPVTVPPGRYATADLRPGLTATVPDGWLLRGQQADLLELLASATDGSGLSILHPTRPLRPSRAFTTTAAIHAPDAVEDAPADYVAWLRSNTRLSLSESKPVEKGSLRGTQVDVTVRSPYTADYCGRPCVSLFKLDGDAVFALFPTNRNRIYVFTAGSSQILVVMEAPVDSFDAFADKADRLVETVTFTP